MAGMLFRSREKDTVEEQRLPVTSTSKNTMLLRD